MTDLSADADNGKPTLSSELIERMTSLVRRMAEHVYVTTVTHGSDANDAYREAEAIVAELPKPVDPDLVHARRIAEARSATRGYLYEPDAFYVGARDSGDDVQIALAAIKRGRDLAKADYGARWEAIFGPTKPIGS